MIDGSLAQCDVFPLLNDFMIYFSELYLDAFPAALSGGNINDDILQFR